MTNTSSSAAGATSSPATTLQASNLMASITVKDLDQSLAWYRDAVGFEVDQEMEFEGRRRAVRLSAGHVQLLLNVDNGAKGWERVKGEGLSLQLTTSQSIDEIADRIRANGFTLDSEPADMPWGVRAFRAKDPDGFKFSFSSERK
jgi:uncharacterized glyoxalase superfamily protein PhnB